MAVSASTVTITGVALGDTMITVTATDTQSQTAMQTIAVTVRIPMASLGAPVAGAITEGDTGGTTLTVDLDGPAPSTGLSVLIDITQSDPTATPANVTYGLDYGVALEGAQAGFSFDSTTTPDMLIVRRVAVPFADGR